MLGFGDVWDYGFSLFLEAATIAAESVKGK